VMAWIIGSLMNDTSGLLELFTRGYPELYWGREKTGQLEIWGEE